MAFSFNNNNNDNFEDDISTISESIHNKTQTIKTQTIKTEQKSNIETEEIKTDSNNLILESDEYSETFETDENNENYQNLSRRSKLKRHENKPLTDSGTNLTDDIINEDSDEIVDKEYTETFENTYNSSSRSSSSSYSNSETSSSTKDYSKTSYSRSPSKKSKSNKYTDTFYTESTTSLTDYESSQKDSLKTDKLLTLEELAKKMRKKLKIKQRNEQLKKLELSKSEYNDDYPQEQIENLINKVQEASNKPKINYSSKLNKKINQQYDKILKVSVNEELINRLKMENYLVDTEKNYNKKIADFGREFINTEFPDQTQTNFEKISEELYYRYKCDLVKFKFISDKIYTHENYYVDSINLIGDLASGLPKPTASAKETWKKLLAPLNK